MKIQPKPLHVGSATLNMWVDIPMLPLAASPQASLQGATTGFKLEIRVGEPTRTGVSPTLTLSGQAPVGLESWGLEGRLTLPLN